MLCLYCGEAARGDFCCQDHRASYLAEDAAGLPATNLLTVPQPESNPWNTPRSYPHESWKSPIPPEMPRLDRPAAPSTEPAAASPDDAQFEILNRNGIYPFGIYLLRPLGGIELALNLRAPKPSRKFWWRSTQPKKVPKLKPKALTSFTPKGFTSEVPMSVSQPFYRSLRRATRSGENSMVETSERSQVKFGKATLTMGAPNMQLAFVRQSALHLSEKRWKNFEFPTSDINPLDYPSQIEWTNSTRLYYELSGFDFAGEPDVPVRSAAAVPGETPLVNVASLVFEEEQDEQTPVPAPAWLDLVWDELDESQPAEPGLQQLASALELYEPPPAPRKVEAKTDKPSKEEPPAASHVVDVEVEPEPPFQAPDMLDLFASNKPAVRASALPPASLPTETLAVSPARMHMPALAIEPLRLRICHGPSPEPPAPPKPEPVAEPLAAAEAPVVEAPPRQPQAGEDKPVDAKLVETAKSEPPKVESRPEPAQKLSRHERRKQRRSERRDNDHESIEEPLELGEDVEMALADPAKPGPERQVAEIAPPVEDKPKPKPSEQKRSPAVESAPSFGGLADAPVSAAATQSLSLGLNAEALPEPNPGLGAGAKIAIATAILAGIGAIAYWQLGGESKAPSAPARSSSTAGLETAGAVIGDAGWTTDYTLDDRGQRLRQIAFYKPSMHVSDYRVEFQAEIDYKAASWVVRAANTKNYYVLKLVQVKSGLPPVINLTRQAFVDGKPGQSVETPLPFKVSPGMVYRVRMDAIGGQFAVTIQDKLVDQWTDTNMISGGFGVANEGAERGQIRAVQLFHLRHKSAK